LYLLHKIVFKVAYIMTKANLVEKMAKDSGTSKAVAEKALN